MMSPEGRHPRRVVIVGCSAAGLATANMLRRQGYDGMLTVVGVEVGAPYDRPPLSKQVLSGDWDADRARLLPVERIAALELELISPAEAAGLDTTARRVRLSDGRDVPYDELVIATGVRPRQLPGNQPTGVHTLRTIDDALSLRADMVATGELTVVGAGFLGLEVAATASTLGITVRVVEPVRDPLSNRLGPRTAARLLDVHRSRGVEVYLGRGLAALLAGPGGRVEAIQLADGTRLATTTVLVAIGSRPNTEWLAGSGLDIHDGVECDEFCRAAPNVWAAGDVAQWKHLGLGRQLRVEHRTNATEQGIAVARNMLGEPRAYRPLPYFWTDQYGVRIQFVGVAGEGADDALIHGSPNEDSYVRAFTQAGDVVGVVAWNAAKALTAHRRELGNRPEYAESDQPTVRSPSTHRAPPVT